MSRAKVFMDHGGVSYEFEVEAATIEHVLKAIDLIREWRFGPNPEYLFGTVVKKKGETNAADSTNT